MKQKKTGKLLLILVFLVGPLIAIFGYGIATVVLSPATSRPTRAPGTLYAEAIPLCEAAFSSPLAEGTPELYLLYLHNNQTYKNELGWIGEGGIPFAAYRAQSASEVRTLVCKKETAVPTVAYTGGVTGYRIDWEVRLVSWPDGAVLAAESFSGSNPHEMELVPQGADSVYGNEPSSAALKEWLVANVVDETRIRTGDIVHSIALSPDGRILASGCYNDPIVRLWDVETRQEIRALEGHTLWVADLAFSPDGEILASASGDDTVRLWDVVTGQEVATLQAKGLTSSVAFSPDGNILASGGDGRGDPIVKLWSVATGQEVATFHGHTKCVNDVAFSPDGETLASASGDYTARLWDVATGQEVQILQGHTSYVHCVAFSRDGRTLATGSFDATIKLWDVSTGQEIKTLSGHTEQVHSLAFSPDGKILASGSDDNTVKLWDVATGQEIETLARHFLGVYSVVFSPDGKTLISGSADETIKLWDVGTER